MMIGQVDIAVHSMKDVPTALPVGIVQAAVLKRANVLNILVHKGVYRFFRNRMQPLPRIVTRKRSG